MAGAGLDRQRAETEAGLKKKKTTTNIQPLCHGMIHLIQYARLQQNNRKKKKKETTTRRIMTALHLPNNYAPIFPGKRRDSIDITSLHVEKQVPAD